MTQQSTSPESAGTSALMAPEDLVRVAGRFRVLSSPSRLQILNALMEGPRCMGELMEVTGLEQSNLSRHVTALEQGGCVARRRDGQRVLVEVIDDTLKPLCEIVCGAAG